MLRTIKVVLIGSSGTGKTSLRGQYISGQFSANYRTTIGTDFITKNVTWNAGNHSQRENNDSNTDTEANYDERSVILQIWDTAGQERFSALSSAFFRGADAVILVFDVRRPQTLDELKNWWTTFVEKCPVPEGEEGTWPIALVANKLDLLEEEDYDGRKRVREMARTFLEDIIPGQLEIEGLDAMPIPTTSEPQSILVNGAPPNSSSSPSHFIANGHSQAGAYDIDPNATMTSARTGFSVYHTPSSSLFDSFESVLSSLSPSLGRDGSIASRSSAADSSRSRSRARRVTRTSLSSSSATITPSLFAQRERIAGDGEHETDDDAMQRSTPSALLHPGRGAQFFFASAKTGDGIHDVFEYIARRSIARIEWVEAMERSSVYTMSSRRPERSTNHDRILNLGALDMHRLRGKCCAS